MDDQVPEEDEDWLGTDVDELHHEEDGHQELCEVEEDNDAAPFCWLFDKLEAIASRASLSHTY
jgi:hypothetical protein